MVEVSPTSEVGQSNDDSSAVGQVDACHTLMPFSDSIETGSKAENEIDLMIQLSGMTGITTQSNS